MNNIGKMKNYQNGKIYKITSPQSNKYYIGSTQLTLDERFRIHLSKYKIGGEGSCTSIQLLQYDDCKIELIENFPCENENELRRREGKIQLENIDMIVNRCIAGQTPAEYYNLHKEVLLKKQHIYVDKNKEVIYIRNKKYRDSHKEEINKNNKEYHELNKEEIHKNRKKYHELNKEEINKKRREIYQKLKSLKNN